MSQGAPRLIEILGASVCDGLSWIFRRRLLGPEMRSRLEAQSSKVFGLFISGTME